MRSLKIDIEESGLARFLAEDMVGVVGPGGNQFADYSRVGLPLALVLLPVVLFATPIFWPV